MVEISRRPVLGPLQLSLFNLSPNLLVQEFEKEEPQQAFPWALRALPSPTAMQSFIFFSPFSNWKRMLLPKQ